MNNKKETPVSWVVDKLFSDNEIFGVPEGLLEHALQMEAKKQQKYDEMINVLERALDDLYIADSFFQFEIEQLIKEAKEL
jgi:hypothetical protein